ncbi:MAG TPA: carboxyl transferase domain-containing protein [Candidatus Dormibacteraeota bacterium]|nr:carboxyl transferase domain-containing protein [Candidatus Dormibacteraeota bacterium]
MTAAPPPDPAARERLEALLDPGSLFELDAAVRLAGDGVAAGVGTIDRRDVAVCALGPGATGEAAAAKVAKVHDVALRSRIPIVAIDGRDRATADEDLAGLAGWTDVLARQARASGVIPQVGVVLGGGSARLADFVVGIGEAGVADAAAADEAGCWAAVRRLLSYLPSHSGEAPPFHVAGDAADRAEPELQALAGRGVVDARWALTRLLDDGCLLELRAGVASNVLIGLGRLGGHAVGVVANRTAALDGAIDAAAATKAARFVRTCAAFNVPLVTLVDTPGLAGGESGAELAAAYARAAAPKLTVLTGRAGGEAYGVMAPRQLGADLVLAWPTAEVGGSDVYTAAERGFVDDVIEPRETRRALVHGLALCRRRMV